MLRQNTPVIVTILCLFTVASASGYWADTTSCCNSQTRGGTVGAQCDQMVDQYRHNNLWPQYYLDMDRQRARSPFDQMVRNGWRRQNLVGEHHFNDDSTQLTESGKLRIKWILTQAPEQYRQIFVEQSLKTTRNVRRMQLVKDFANQIEGDASATMISSTHIISEGRPAPVVDYVNTAFQENMPVPQLPESAFKGLDAEE